MGDVGTNGNGQGIGSPYAGETVSDFLGAFYPDANEEIRLRFFKPKGAPKGLPQFSPEKVGVTRVRLANDKGLQSLVLKLNGTRGAYFVVNAGGDSDGDITRVTSFYAEIDDLPIEQQLEIFQNAPIKPSILIITRKSVHCYWLRAGDCSVEEWREIQQRQIAFFGSDVTIKNPSRVMRLPFFDHVHFDKETGELERKRVELHTFEPNRRYTVEQMFDAFPAVEKEQQEQRREEHESKKNTARFWTGFVFDLNGAEDRRRIYGERALETACNIIREAPDGARFDARRRAGVLVGGYIAGGMLDYGEAMAALSDAVASNTASYDDAVKVLKSAIDHGQSKLISFEEKEAEFAEWVARQQKPPRPQPTAEEKAEGRRAYRAALHETIKAASDIQSGQAERELSEAVDIFNFIYSRSKCPPKVKEFINAVIGAMQEKARPGQEGDWFPANDYDIGKRMRGEDEGDEAEKVFNRGELREMAAREGVSVREFCDRYNNRRTERIKKVAQRGRAACDAWQKRTGYVFVDSMSGGQKEGVDHPTQYKVPILIQAAEALLIAREKRATSKKAIQAEAKVALRKLEATLVKKERFRRPGRDAKSVFQCNHALILTKLEKNLRITAQRTDEDAEDPIEYLDRFIREARAVAEKLGFTVDAQPVVHTEEEKDMDKAPREFTAQEKGAWASVQAWSDLKAALFEANAAAIARALSEYREASGATDEEILARASSSIKAEGPLELLKQALEECEFRMDKSVPPANGCNSNDKQGVNPVSDLHIPQELISQPPQNQQNGKNGKSAIFTPDFVTKMADGSTLITSNGGAGLSPERVLMLWRDQIGAVWICIEQQKPLEEVWAALLPLSRGEPPPVDAQWDYDALLLRVREYEAEHHSRAAG